MTSAATLETVLDRPAIGVEWRRLQPRLWVARTVEGPLGMVERGRGYTAVDRHDVVLGRFRTLQQAQAAVGGRTAPAARRRASAPLVPAVTALAGVVTFGLSGYALLAHV